MSGYSFKVPPRNWESIECVAHGLRTDFKCEDVPYFPIMDVLERVMDHNLDGFHLLTGYEVEMGDAEGYTHPDGSFIMLREDVYHAAWHGDHRARFTAAHELGHWMMHTNTPLERTHPAEKIEAFRLSEPQANQFAAALLMPSYFFRSGDTASVVRHRHGVSHTAACNRIGYLKKKGKLV